MPSSRPPSPARSTPPPSCARPCPPAIAARIDFATLTHRPGSFVDSELAARHTDLLFSANLAGRPAYLHLLFEHQSDVHPLMAFRLLGYMVRIWEDHLAKHPNARRLPAILPVVLHHSETGWSADVSFEALLDLDPATLAALADFIPRFRFVLVDISFESDHSIRRRAITAFGRLVLWCLRHGRQPDELLRRLAAWADLVREVRAGPGGAAALAAIWRYIFSVSEPLPPEELLAKMLDAVGKDAEEEIVTVAEQLQERGRLKGLAEILLRQLSARFGALPAAVTTRVQAADPSQLVLWADRVLTEPTLSAVLGDP
jgi:hypothetical protein